MTIGEKIKKIRIEKKLTQKELGLRCKPIIAESTIRRYEIGDLKSPKPVTIQRIADGLGITYNELIKDTETDQEKNYIIRPYHIKKDFDHVIPNSTESEKSFYEMCKKLIEERNISNETTINTVVKINRNSPINSALIKIRNGETLNPEEQQALDNFIQSGEFQRAFDSFSDSMKKLAELLRQNYELLNEEGQKKADKHIEYAADQIELLTKIPEYQKNPK